MRGRDIMVPLPEKRHRIYEDELEQVTKGPILRLGELLESEEDQERKSCLPHHVPIS